MRWLHLISVFVLRREVPAGETRDLNRHKKRVYNNLRGAVEDKLTGTEKAAMAFYPLVDMPPEMIEVEADNTGLTAGSTVTVKGVQYIVDQ